MNHIYVLYIQSYHLHWIVLDTCKNTYHCFGRMHPLLSVTANINQIKTWFCSEIPNLIDSLEGRRHIQTNMSMNSISLYLYINIKYMSMSKSGIIKFHKDRWSKILFRVNHQCIPTCNSVILVSFIDLVWGMMSSIRGNHHIFSKNSRAIQVILNKQNLSDITI